MWRPAKISKCPHLHIFICSTHTHTHTRDMPSHPKITQTSIYLKGQRATLRRKESEGLGVMEPVTKAEHSPSQISDITQAGEVWLKDHNCLGSLYYSHFATKHTVKVLHSKAPQEIRYRENSTNYSSVHLSVTRQVAGVKGPKGERPWRHHLSLFKSHQCSLLLYGGHCQKGF